CLPGVGGTVVFYDEGCTQPALTSNVTDWLCSEVTYGHLSPFETEPGRGICGGGRAGPVYRRGVARTAMASSGIVDGRCTTTSFGYSITLYDGVPVPDSAFVAAEEVLEPHGGGLAGSTLIAEDGARQVRAPRDVA